MPVRLGYSESGKGRRRAEKALLEAMDVLVAHFKLEPPVKSRTRHWGDGSKAETVRDEDGNPAQAEAAA